MPDIYGKSAETRAAENKLLAQHHLDPNDFDNNDQWEDALRSKLTETKDEDLRVILADIIAARDVARSGEACDYPQAEALAGQIRDRLLKEAA